MSDIITYNFTRQMVLALTLMGGFYSSVAVAQTVTVDPTGTADGTTIFTDLQSAVNSFAVAGTNEANGAPNVIHVISEHGPITGNLLAARPDGVDSTPETLVVNDSISIEGVTVGGSPDLAVFAGTPLLSSRQTIRSTANPAVLWRQPHELSFKNIAFIPADPGAGDIIKSFIVAKSTSVPDEHTTITIEDCVFSGNDGTDHPITTTGVAADDSKINDAGAILMPAGSAGIYVFSRSERGDMALNITRSVFASLSALTGANPRVEAIKAWESGPAPDIINCTVNVNEGCVFANLDGNVAQISWGGAIHMKGTEPDPIVVRNLQNIGSPATVWLYFSPADNQPVAGDFQYVNFYNCVAPTISEGGVLGDGSRAFINSIDHCVFANGGDSVSLRSGTSLDPTGVATVDTTISNSVFHNVGTGAGPSAVYGYASSSRNLTVTDSYFTDVDANGTGLYNSGASGTWNVSDSTLSLTGATALLADINGSVNLVSGISNDEVTYVNMDDPFSPNFFKVTPSSLVNDWAIY